MKDEMEANEAFTYLCGNMLDKVLSMVNPFENEEDSNYLKAKDFDDKQLHTKLQLLILI